MTRREEAERAKCEEVIGRGLGSYVEVGRELAKMRDKRLYRDTHPTFEDYCRERWGMSRVHAHHQIEAAEIALTMVNTDRPQNERQARELAPLKGKPEQMVEAWEEASADGTPTAAKVKKAIASRRPKADPPRLGRSP